MQHRRSGWLRVLVKAREQRLCRGPKPLDGCQLSGDPRGGIWDERAEFIAQHAAVVS
ncbi:hypothetical protein SAMN05216533_0154 [Streptomyces sp. Ag109_O5-10]|nr:hypothetical protein SAMN05216533_0154 [Streptomyces sp. Ag109_O5-10]